MFQLAEDVLKYSIILILEVANDNKEYDYISEFNSLINSDLVKSLNISSNDFYKIVNKYIDETETKNVKHFNVI